MADLKTNLNVATLAGAMREWDQAIEVAGVALLVPASARSLNLYER